MGSSLSCVSNLDYSPDPYDNFNSTSCNCSNPDHIWIAVCECEFDYEEVTTPQNLERVVPLGIVYALVFLMGTIGNGLVIFVVRRFKRMRNVTNIFLASLSTADLLLIWFCVPIQVGEHVPEFSEKTPTQKKTTRMGIFWVFCAKIHPWAFFALKNSLSGCAKFTKDTQQKSKPAPPLENRSF